MRGGLLIRNVRDRLGTVARGRKIGARDLPAAGFVQMQTNGMLWKIEKAFEPALDVDNLALKGSGLIRSDLDLSGCILDIIEFWADGQTQDAGDLPGDAYVFICEFFRRGCEIANRDVWGQIPVAVGTKQ